MNNEAQLTAIAGPLKGQSFLISIDQFFLGRDPGCSLPIHDSSISRKHCVIKRQTDVFQIVDLESLNGTYVNGLPVQEQLLQDGSQIELGDSVFLFFELDSHYVGSSDVLISPELKLPSTHELFPSEATLLNPARIGSRSSATDSKLQQLLTLLTSIQKADELQAIYRKLIEFLPDALPMQSGTILLCGTHPNDIESVISFGRNGRIQERFLVAKNLVERALENNIAILSNHRSTRGSAQSILCVPLFCFGLTIGAIYLVAQKRKKFEESHLQLMAAIASVCAVGIHQMQRISGLERNNLFLEAELNARQDLIGASASIRKVQSMIGRVASTDSTVLVLGETGTGKEMVARAIHRNSRRASRDFIAINCGAIPETLMESELFGFTKGAFTGAAFEKKGKIETANGGTLLLDEVADLPLALQAKLLRVIQEREIEKLGSTKSVSVDIRLIAATNKDLRKSMELEQFREDLFHRLNVFTIELPPLRERKEDIPLLANRFLSLVRTKLNKEIDSIAPDLMNVFIDYHWPGNVRELQNTIERAAIMASSTALTVDDVPLQFAKTEGTEGRLNYQTVVDKTKKQAILNALRQSGGNHTLAAKTLGLQRTYLHELIRKFKIKV